MQRARATATLATAMLVLAACGAEGGPQVGGGSSAGTALDESTWRIVSDGPGGPPEDHHEKATAAVDPDDLAEQWEAYRADGSPDDLADGEVAILVGFGESGSCPEEVGEIRVDEAAGEVIVDREIEGGPGQACTDDYNPRTIVLGVDAGALPDEPFLLASVGTQRTVWHGVAPSGSDRPPADHPHLGLGYGQPEPVATLAAQPQQARSGEQVELVATAAEADAEPAVGDGTAPDPHDEAQLRDLEAAGELEEHGRLAPGRLDRWTSYRWVATQSDQEAFEGHPAVERTEFGQLGPGASATAGNVDTAELEPGWYRVTLEVIGFDQRGPADISTQFEVTEK